MEVPGHAVHEEEAGDEAARVVRVPVRLVRDARLGVLAVDLLRLDFFGHEVDHRVDGPVEAVLALVRLLAAVVEPQRRERLDAHVVAEVGPRHAVDGRDGHGRAAALELLGERLRKDRPRRERPDPPGPTVPYEHERSTAGRPRRA